MVEETANVEKDINLRKNKPDLAKTFGRLSNKAFFAAQHAIKNGEDVKLVGENYKGNLSEESLTIRGAEIQEWGLNPDTLLFKKDKEIEAYEREIL